MNIATLFDQQVSIVGAGTMGAGIAELFVMHGWNVCLFDQSPKQAQAVKDTIEEKHGHARSRLISLVPNLHLLPSGGFVIESVPENLSLKIKVLSEIEDVLDPVLLSTNTSSLGIEDMQIGLREPKKFLGLHFFQPVPKTQLMEVVHSSQTAEETLHLGIQCAQLLQRKPIVVIDSPGFATSRLAVAFALEAMRMVEEGIATAEDIDAGMRLGYGHQVGPLRMSDQVGLDVRLAISEHLANKLGSRFSPPQILRDMVKNNRLGRKTGEGFFVWNNKQE